MGRYDIYANPTPADRSHTAFVQDMQNNPLSLLATRVVTPLRSPKALATPAQSLNPPIDLDGRMLWLDTASLAPLPVALLKKPVANVVGQSTAVLDALDTLFGSP